MHQPNQEDKSIEVLFGLCFVLITIIGGVRRLKEGREEWGKLANKREEE